MAAVTIRSLSDEAHRVLKQRATVHGRSTEAEMRSILEEAALPEGRLKIGSSIAALAREYGGFDLDIKRDQMPTELVKFE